MNPKATALFLGLISLYLIIKTFLFSEESVSVAARFQLGRRRKPWYIFILKLFSPLNRILLGQSLKENLSYQLDIINSPLAPEDLLSLQELISILGTGFIYILFRETLPLWIYITSALTLFFIPYFHLYSQVQRRKRLIIKYLPETIDILGLCISAGLDFMGAVQWVITKVKGNAFIEELKKVVDQITLGKSKIDALRTMSQKLKIPDISSFTRTLIQAERMGTPVSEAFAILAEDVRLRRFQRGEKIALVAPLKILIPLIFCILPVIGIVIGGPILLEFMQGGLGGVF